MVEFDIVLSEVLQLLLNHRLDLHIIQWFAIGHWVLIILWPKNGIAYILDSLKRSATPAKYPIVSIIDEALPGTYKWKIAKCFKQKADWECGFVVIKHMKEFVETIQHNCPTEEFWNKNMLFSSDDIEQMVLNLMSMLVSKEIEGHRKNIQ
ncbi:hypothetical protein L2E82_01554 [Cichorium intybus]|uniref:Uncharacterized protein n=1 Tax=Cichorium intybus TaxID=13427 RepID=A0ACB9H0A9_CICIN|nr:hypothetical protein L2E82_01554 [Cichorium intybus]